MQRSVMRNPVELTRLFADIMNSHDANRFAELVSENYVNHNPGVGPGRAGLIAFMGHLFDTLSDTRVVMEDAFAVGDRVVGHRFVEHWDELNLLEVFQQMGAIPKQGGAA